MSTIPVIAGFYPDPSICHVDDTYYLVTSSFEYRPGVPLFTSRDLITWSPLECILQRPEQLRPTTGAPSRGIFASTIRHHDGRFWMATTHFEDFSRGQMIVSAENPAGPWSDPVFVDGAIGIDPDLVWDDEGTCHLTWAAHDILSAPIDPATGEMLAPPRQLWSGTGMVSPEGPHLYSINDYWYLLIAEGGTERGHSVSIARARSLDGPWEPAPSNPILTHRSTDHPVQNTGHADLVHCADGSWALVHLGARPRGVSPKFHTNGRETFLVGVEWVDGWPVIDEERFDVPVIDHSFVDDFSTGKLDSRWISPGDFPANFTSFEASALVLDAAREGPAPSLLATRVRDEAWTAEVQISCQPDLGSLRFAVRINPDHWYGLEVTTSGVEGAVSIGPATTVTGKAPLPETDYVRLRISARAPQQSGPVPSSAPDLISLALLTPDGSVRHSFGEFDGRYLSTEVAGGFTGRVLSLEPREGQTRVMSFAYRTDGLPTSS